MERHLCKFNRFWIEHGISESWKFSLSYDNNISLCPRQDKICVPFSQSRSYIFLSPTADHPFACYLYPCRSFYRITVVQLLHPQSQLINPKMQQRFVTIILAIITISKGQWHADVTHILLWTRGWVLKCSEKCGLFNKYNIVNPIQYLIRPIALVKHRLNFLGPRCSVRKRFKWEIPQKQSYVFVSLTSKYVTLHIK